MADRSFFIVTVTDTFSGDLNYSWSATYQVKATSLKHAITRVKKTRYLSPVPRHRVHFASHEEMRVDLVNQAIALCAEHKDRDTFYRVDRVID